MNASKSLAVAVAAALTAVAISVAVQPAKAALISWSPSQTVSGTLDVDTAGTLFASANIASASSTTVNGVTFNAFPITPLTNSASVGNIAVAGSHSFNSVSVTSGSTPYSSLPLDYRNLLGNALVMSNVGNQLTVTISNLTVGASYAIQYWANDARSNGAGRSTAVGSQILDVNSTDAAGGVGQWVRGTFVADATSQSFTASSATSTFTYANALQVRLVAIPEPSTWALGAAGCACAASWSKLRRRRQ